MFIKPFKIRSNILITGSDKKRLKAKISSQFDEVTENELNELLSKKGTVSAVKATTYHGENVVIYTSDKKPVLFEIDNIFYPTVYALWIAPNMIPHFTTHPNVLPVLARGADLMIPGIVKQGTDRKSWGNYKKNEIVAVNLTSNKASVGVGTLARDSDDLYMSGNQGICVKMLHVFGDKLWGMEPTVCQQIPLMNAVISVPKDSDFPPLGSEKAPKLAPKIFEVEKKISQIDFKSEETSDDKAVEDENESEKADQPAVEEQEEKENPDNILKAGFLNALKLHGKKMTFPILTSTFYPQYVKTELPETLDIKKTSYKKVGTFLKKMSEERFIEIREEKKGIEKIHSINIEHPEILSYRPYKNRKPDEEITSETTNHQLLLTKMTEIFAVNEDTAKFFANFNLGVGKCLDETQVKNHVKDYVGRNKLMNNVTKIIDLDDTLKEICNGRETILSVGELGQYILSRMTSSFEMRSQAGPIVKAGKKPVIHLTTATRSGNKKVTLISNLQDYGINIADFSKMIKVQVASSVTMTEVPGTKGELLMVQGNHVKFVYDTLVAKYKIPRSGITGLEFALKEKKKKEKK